MPYFTKKGTGKDKGKTCVYKKEGKTKVGCTAGPIEKYMAALHIHETEELDWLSGPAQIRLGDIKDNIKDYVSVGDTIYISGTLAMGEYEELNPNNSIELDMEPVIVKEFRGGINGGINVIFGNNITTLPLWTSEIANDWVDIGHISTDDDLIITIPEKKSITESKELDWLSGPTQIRFGDIKGNFRDYLSAGDTIYISGILHITDNNEEPNSRNSIFFNMEPAVVKEYENEDDINRLYIKFGGNITSLPIWMDNMSSGWVDLGGFESDDDLIITIPEKKSITESEENDLDWIKDIGGDTDSLIAQLKTHIKEHVPVAHLELDWDQTSGGGEYFGRVWLYDRFYELYKYGKTFTVRFYERDPRTDQYHQYDQYENLVQTRLLTILLNELIDYNRKNLSESEADEWGWTRDIKPKTSYEDYSYLKNFDQEYVRNPEDIKVGDLLRKPNGHSIYRVEKIEDYNISGEIDSLGNTINKDISYKVKNVITNRSSIIKPYIKIGVSYPSRTPRYKKVHLYKLNLRNLNESEEFGDFEWAKEIEADLEPGRIYDIKTGNGYYWVPELFVGKKWDDEYNIEMYKFKDLDGSGSGAKSTPYVKELIQKGHIRPYDPNWSIKDELTFSDNLEDALKGNFVIYFKDGVYLDQTLPIQDKLFEMGFSFYTKGPNEYITNKDSSGKIQFFECFNWDTSNPRYSSMPPNQWDLKKILLVKVSDEDTRWRRTRNPRLEEQELFLTVSNHNAIVINGDKYVTNNITESEEFDWIHQQEPEKELKKTKSYVVDVSHLRPTPMRYSHDTSLTRQDILRRFEDLGYNVDGIDVDSAKHFYIEPQETGYWDDVTWIPQNYWVDYDTGDIKDPSVGGKYQVIDIDELMFLLDNNLISESKKPINEVAGISFESRKWADIIYNEIISNPEEKTRLIIDGYDYPEAFDQFPIDYVVIDYYDRITGYGQEHSGYDQDGNYVVLLYIQPKLVQGQGGYSLKSALNHEMKHAWEDYNRISKGKPNIEQTKESKELYNRDFILLMSDNNIVGPIKDVLKYFYYLSKLEVSPYLENVYDENPAYENMVRQITTKDFESFKNRFDLDINWHLINTAYNIPFVKKFKSPRDFIDYSAKELRKRATKVLKKINKMKYIHGKI